MMHSVFNAICALGTIDSKRTAWQVMRSVVGHAMVDELIILGCILKGEKNLSHF